MSYFRPWLLTATPLIFASFVACTASGQSTQLSSPSINNLVIDMDSGRAETAEWTASVEDCSTDEIKCLRVVGHVGIAFPKNCADIAGKTSWKSPVGTYRVVAPQAHYGLPYGSYTASDYPNALLYYRKNVGFSEVRFLKAAPSESSFDPNEYTGKYNLVIRGKFGDFQCRE